MKEKFKQESKYTSEELRLDALAGYITSLQSLISLLKNFEVNIFKEKLQKYLEEEKEVYDIFLTKKIKDLRVEEIHNLCVKLEKESNLSEQLGFIISIRDKSKDIEKDLNNIIKE